MVPVVIGDSFAAYHPAPDVAVLMLPGFGIEAAGSRVWRDLSLRLAARGIASLRPDLPGTGDSAGDAEDPAILEAWRRAVDDCAAWLAARHGGRVALLGYRLGALLALDAVGRGVAARQLVLLEPPASGQALAREITLRAQMEFGSSAPDAEGFVHAVGTAIATVTLTALARLPQGPSGTPPETLVFSPRAGLPERGWARQWREAGAAIAVEPFPGHAELAAEGRPPLPVLERIVAFLDPGPAIAAAPPPPPAGLSGPGWREEPVWFGPAPRRFGILCHPAHAAPGAPAVVLPSVAAQPRGGQNRAWTDLARRLAAEGIPSFRFDHRGVGESDGPTGEDQLCDAYEPELIEGVREAVAAMAARGHPRSLVVGLCSGAYLAWHAAAEEPRIAGLVLANPQFLHRLPRISRAALLRSPMARIRTPGALLRLVGGRIAQVRRGEARAGEVAELLGGALRRALREVAWQAARRMGMPPPPVAFARRQLTLLLRRGCAVQFVYGTADPGLEAFQAAFGAPAALPPGARVTMVEGADHGFSTRPARARLIEVAAIAAHALQETRLPAGAGRDPAARQARPRPVPADRAA